MHRITKNFTDDVLEKYRLQNKRIKVAMINGYQTPEGHITEVYLDGFQFTDDDGKVLEIPRHACSSIIVLK